MTTRGDQVANKEVSIAYQLKEMSILLEYFFIILTLSMLF